MTPSDNEKKGHSTAGAANAASSVPLPVPLPRKRLTRKQKLAVTAAIVLVLLTGLLAAQQLWMNISLPLLPVKTFAVPPDWRMPPMSELGPIIPGPDGNLWFLARQGDWIGRITPEGVFTKFPTRLVGPYLWTTLEWGTDGNLWANAYSLHGLWRLNPHTGALKSYNYLLEDLVVAHDGSVWFKDGIDNAIGYLDLRTGAIRHYPVAPTVGHLGCCTGGITEAADGEIWFAIGNNEIGVVNQVVRVARLDPKTGTITSFPIPSAFLSIYHQMMTPAADGGIWLLCGKRISTSNVLYPVHVSPTGVVTTYQAPNKGNVLNFTLAPNGTLWMTYHDSTVNPSIVLARLTAGTIIPVGRLSGEDPSFITFGPDHRLWITTYKTIERVDVSY